MLSASLNKNVLPSFLVTVQLKTIAIPGRLNPQFEYVNEEHAVSRCMCLPPMDCYSMREIKHNKSI